MSDELIKVKIATEFKANEMRSVEDILARLNEIVEFQEETVDDDEYKRILKINEKVQDDIDYFLNYLEQKFGVVKYADGSVEFYKGRGEIDREFMETIARTLNEIKVKAMQYQFDTEHPIETFYGQKFDPDFVWEAESEFYAEKGFGGFWTGPLSGDPTTVSQWQHLLDDDDLIKFGQRSHSDSFRAFKRKPGARVWVINDEEDLLELAETFLKEEHFQSKIDDQGYDRESALYESINWEEFYEDFDAVYIKSRAIRSYDVVSAHWKDLEQLEDLGEFKIFEGIQSLSRKSAEAIVEIKRLTGQTITPDDTRIRTPRFGPDNFHLENYGEGTGTIADGIRDVTEDVTENELDSNQDIDVSEVETSSDNNLSNFSEEVKESFNPDLQYHDVDEDPVVDLRNIDVGSISKEITIYLGLIDVSIPDDIVITSKIKAIVNNYLISYVKQLFAIAETYR